MKQSADIRKVLQSWPYDPEKDARLTEGEDGREILQVRTPVGIEQYELDGRPDGVRPHGCESALEYHLQRLESAEAGGRSGDFKLGQRECNELFSEGTLYYFRYVRLFQLKDWERTVRDTSRNLRVFDFIHRYAKRPEDQQFLEKWRPYIIRVNTSAAAMLELERQAYDKALKIATAGIEQIEGLEELEDETFQFERNRSVTALRELASQIQRNRPLSELEQLEHQLRRAIERQEFERAAQLRDRIRALRKQQVC
ncbi:MAG TPA: UvrB/UvrC motif-containing protein [Verrucomicrobiae bacterium]|nr:UvrB/UvrC motif-containing protein [Verrucomicrobiae bacterium]